MVSGSTDIAAVGGGSSEERMRAFVTDSARRRLSPNGCGPKPSNLYYLLVKLCLGTQPRPIDFCCYIWGQRNFRPILMVSVNVNMEHSMFMFARDSRPYGSIFQHDIENSMQAQVMSPKHNFNNMNFGFFYSSWCLSWAYFASVLPVSIYINIWIFPPTIWILYSPSNGNLFHVHVDEFPLCNTPSIRKKVILEAKNVSGKKWS